MAGKYLKHIIWMSCMLSSTANYNSRQVFWNFLKYHKSRDKCARSNENTRNKNHCLCFNIPERFQHRYPDRMLAAIHIRVRVDISSNSSNDSASLSSERFCQLPDAEFFVASAVEVVWGEHVVLEGEAVHGVESLHCEIHFFVFLS